MFVEQHSPGWRAWVDGHEATVERANVFVLGVRAPAGRHSIALQYRPPGLGVGIAGSLLGLGIVGLLRVRRRSV